MKKRLLLLVVCLAAVAVALFVRGRRDAGGFERSMTIGQGYLEKGDATNAMTAYSRSVKLAPESVDARLNLANACLLAGDSRAVIEQCQAALALDHNNAAAYYLMGCAHLRLNEAGLAVQAFQQSQKIDPAVDALNFQLGLAQERLGNLEDAIREFETLFQFQPNHPSGHYQLSRLYLRVNRTAEAAQELAKHQELLAKNPGVPSGPATFERCQYTRPRVAFRLAQPERNGIPVRFLNATTTAFGQQSPAYHGPVGVLDYNHDGRNSLFVMEGNGFRLLNNRNGRFAPLGERLPATNGGAYRRCLIGDLNNDRFEDVVVLGEQASHAFRFATNGQFREITSAAGLKNLRGRDGLLADLDFTGKLDLLAVLPGGEGLSVYRNLGNSYFQNQTTNSGLPARLPGTGQVAMDDWDDEDVAGAFVTRAGQPPLFFAKQRAGHFVQTNLTENWPVGSAMALGDLNNDLRDDMALADDQELHIVFGGMKERQKLSLNGLQVKGILLLDYDNDGWLDVIAFSDGVRVWRNTGKLGFQDVTSATGLDKLGVVESLVAADFDQDGDTDLIASGPGGLQFWRNDGGNANRQLKLRLVGNRSNASGLGVRVELVSGNWRTIRTLTQLPFEIGVGNHDQIDLLQARWFDLATTLTEVSVQPQPMELAELTLPTGSCPYLFVWDGQRFKFVTDILGAAPLGLPVSETRYVEADPEEYLALGNEDHFLPKDGAYEIRITEELREVLYLDEAKLVVVDHPPGTLIETTSKLRAGKPFPPHELWTLRPLASLQQATRSDGLDVTKALARTDRQMVSPVRLRDPQLRGLAEPFSVTMDFGELPADRPLVLVLNGWLRFGGGMANIAASLDPNLPFPFPTLEVELPDGSWKKLDVDVGAPCGKTKTILVDLEEKLSTGNPQPATRRRLRLTTAFEIHWDSAALCERVAAVQNRQVTLQPDRTDLRWRGFSEPAFLPDDRPLTPEYDKVRFTPPWRRTPAGWCTRYGAVAELVQDRDDALVLLNGGDELALSFKADRLPPKLPGFERHFFLYVVGWDKDADFHVAEGWRVEPLPFSGMDDQAYGRQPRPSGLNDAWMSKHNTRWVGPLTLDRNRPRTR